MASLIALAFTSILLQYSSSYSFCIIIIFPLSYSFYIIIIFTFNIYFVFHFFITYNTQFSLIYTNITITGHTGTTQPREKAKSIRKYFLFTYISTLPRHDTRAKHKLVYFLCTSMSALPFTQHTRCKITKIIATITLYFSSKLCLSSVLIITLLQHTILL